MFFLLEFAILLGAIIAIAHLFCNALEALAKRLSLSDGVIGSIFAATATALPETIIPIYALISNHLLSTAKVNASLEAISIGAILGAPFMLSTLSLLVMMIFVFTKRGLTAKLSPNISFIARDLHFFLFAFSVALMVAALNSMVECFLVRLVGAMVIIGGYMIYLIKSLRDDKGVNSDITIIVDHDNADNKDFAVDGSKSLASYLGMCGNSLLVICLQLLVAISLLIYSAHYFVILLEKVASHYHIAPFIVSLLLVPLATEMPEKVNSIIWLRQGKDSLAFGNITGAMVFQGSVLACIGMLCTKWSLSGNYNLIIIIISTLVAALWLYWRLCYLNSLRLWHLCINGAIYLVAMILLLICS